MTYVSDTNVYPFKLFTEDVPTPEFAPITILYGGNGSGKTIILNSIAQYPELGCSAPYNKTKFFDRFKQLSSAKLQAMMSASLSYARRKGVTERFRKYSNGENALLYFTDTIGETGLYLPVEPKNSLSPALQLHLAEFLKASMELRTLFIIATHSPLLLFLPGARVYDI